MARKPRAPRAQTLKTTAQATKTSAASKSVAAAPAQPATGVYGWGDDPGAGAPIVRPVPDLGKAPFAFAFSGPAVAADLYKVGTPEFRYWAAAEALRRGADFWAAHVPATQWQPGATLQVLLDAGDDLNAYYNREALNFFQGPNGADRIYTGESPDVVCHEMGHAILDAIKPQLWNAASQEAAAFHESFGDMSAMLSALQLESMRVEVLTSTGYRIRRNSRLSRLAEQLGGAIRLQNPDAVDADCLRNANNSFTYVDPINLPQMGPASQLSSEPHSFSRVFTGAFLDILAGMLVAKAADPKMPTEAELLAVTGEIAAILVEAIGRAAVVSNFYAQVAAAMVEAAGNVNAAYKQVVRSTFVQRSILAAASAWDLDTPKMAVAAVSAGLRPEQANQPLAPLALSARDYGFDRPLVVDAASHPRAYVARAAAVVGVGHVEPVNASTAAAAFVNDLFARDHIDCSNAGGADRNYSGRLRSHAVVESGGTLKLERRFFHCGFCS